LKFYEKDEGWTLDIDEDNGTVTEFVD